ncbi:MAG: hypothetical protein FWE42_06790 [Defluviitaleaceae bacterium]|nr:hypothetical protein [Defluviitaleaceae bacterium]
MNMTSRERFVKTLTGQEVDRVPFIKLFGYENTVHSGWTDKYPNLDTYIDELLGFEGKSRGWRTVPVNFGFSGLNPSVVESETDTERLVRRGDGSLEKRIKNQDYHRHMVEFAVKDHNDWDRLSNFLDPYDSSRIPQGWENYVEMYNNRDYPLALSCGGVYGFIRTLMGDENLCFAFYDMPELVEAIISSYVDMCLKVWEVLCKNIQFDLIESWEDMCSKTGSIIGKNTYDQFMAPQFRRIRDFADANKIPIVLVDSDGNSDTLIEWMHDSGVNALYPFEVGAGCDTLTVMNKLPKLGGLGGLEKNACALGKDAIDTEMEKARILIKNGRFIPGPDHFVLNNVDFEGYKHFMNRLREVVLTTRVGG